MISFSFVNLSIKASCYGLLGSFNIWDVKSITAIQTKKSGVGVVSGRWFVSDLVGSDFLGCCCLA